VSPLQRLVRGRSRGADAPVLQIVLPMQPKSRNNRLLAQSLCELRSVRRTTQRPVDITDNLTISRRNMNTAKMKPQRHRRHQRIQLERLLAVLGFESLSHHSSFTISLARRPEGRFARQASSSGALNLPIIRPVRDNNVARLRLPNGEIPRSRQ